jgi:hypothetical protein
MDLEFPGGDVTDDDIGSIMEQLSQLAGSAGEHFFVFNTFTSTVRKLWCNLTPVKVAPIARFDTLYYSNR